jgi:hypothetical protein
MMEDEQTEQAGGDMVPEFAWPQREIQDPAADAGPAPVPAVISAGPLSAEQVVDLARAVVRDLEPEELPVFDAVADAWLRDGLKRRRLVKAPGASAGFGIEAVLLSQLVFPIIAAAVGEVLGDITRERLRARRRSAHHGDAKEVKPADTDSARARENIAHRVVTHQQALALHDACQRHARTLGMSPARAALLADAVAGSLTSAPGGE